MAYVWAELERPKSIRNTTLEPRNSVLCKKRLNKKKTSNVRKMTRFDKWQKWPLCKNYSKAKWSRQPILRLNFKCPKHQFEQQACKGEGRRERIREGNDGKTGERGKGFPLSSFPLPSSLFQCLQRKLPKHEKVFQNTLHLQLFYSRNGQKRHLILKK